MKLLPIILAGNANKQNPRIELVSPSANPTLENITATGELVCKTILNAEPHTETYSGVTSISLQADANTPIVIYGEITALTPRDFPFSSLSVVSTEFTTLLINPYSSNQTIKTLNLNGAPNLNEIDISACTILTDVVFSNNNKIETLKFFNCTLLTPFQLSMFPYVKDVIIRHSLLFRGIDTTGLEYIESIYIQGLPQADSITIDNQTLKSIICTSVNLLSINTRNMTALQKLELTQTKVSALDLSLNTELLELTTSETLIEELSTAGATALQKLVMFSMPKLKKLDISQNTNLTTLSSNYGYTSLSEIKTRAEVQNIANSVAQIISQSPTGGVVYTNDQDTYYSTVADAATAKGWTIEPLA